jgi:hypothetical protein
VPAHDEVGGEEADDGQRKRAAWASASVTVGRELHQRRLVAVELVEVDGALMPLTVPWSAGGWQAASSRHVSA